MKNILLVLIFILSISNITLGQVSVSTAKYNALKEIKKIPEGMTYDEFIKIQRELDWKKIFVSAIFPGYLHFYANHKTEAWIIFGVRVVTAGMMGYAMYDQYQLTSDIDAGIIFDSDEEARRTERNTVIFSSGLFINMLAYAFDWAHGDWVIETERNKVYFKYGLDNKRRKALGISYNTQFGFPALSFSMKF
jgi:hypothetical protein